MSRSAAGRFTLATRHSGQTGAAGNQAANCPLSHRWAGKSSTRLGSGTAPSAGSRSNSPSLIRLLPMSIAMSGVAESVAMVHML